MHQAPPRQSSPLESNPSCSSNFWLLKAVLPGRWGRWLTAVLIFTLLFCLFVFTGNLFREDLNEGVSTATVVFFCFILSYIIPVHHLIVERSLAALQQLQSGFPDEAETMVAYRQRIVRKSRLWYLLTLSLGAAAGTAHNSLLLSGAPLGVVLQQPSTLLSLAVTLTIWVVMTTVISSLVENAVLFNRLGGRITIDALNTRAATPFGSVAVSSTLAIIGAQAAFPALVIDTGSSWVTFVPGLIATGIPMIFLFLLPIMPVHRQIVAGKKQALDKVNADLSARVMDAAGRTSVAYAALEPLLVYRREVSTAPEWPFDTSVIGRLALYLIIPPLTWIGAALIEILVDNAL